MTNEEIISKAFFKGYGITFNYLKKDGDAWEYREMTTISDLKYNNDSDVFVGKRIQYGFNQSNENILKENYAYTFPNSLQNEKFKIQIANNNGNNNITAEIDSFVRVIER